MARRRQYKRHQRNAARKRRIAAIVKRDNKLGSCVVCGHRMPDKSAGETKSSHMRKYHRRKGTRSKAPKRARTVARRRYGTRRAVRKNGRWMQQAFGKHKGSLHKLLGVPAGEKISIKYLQHAKGIFERDLKNGLGKRAFTVRNLRRINAALTARKIATRRKRK